MPSYGSIEPLPGDGKILHLYIKKCLKGNIRKDNKYKDEVSNKTAWRKYGLDVIFFCKKIKVSYN